MALTRDARRRLRRHAVRAARDVVSAAVGARRVGEGRDRQRRRQPQGPPPGDDPAAPARRRGAAAGRAVAPAAGHRLVRQRGDRRGHAGRSGPTGRSTCSCPTWAAPAVLDLLASLGRDRSPRARGAPTIRPATRPCCGSARPSPPGPSRSACRARRTRCASTAGARSAGSWPTPASTLDRVLVQVGGGAFAACTGWGLGAGVRLDAVQTEGCAPLARAWRRIGELGLAPTTCRRTGPS